MSRSLAWYLRRLRQMSPAEVGRRTGDKVRQRRWATRQVAVGEAVLAPGDVLPRRLPARALSAQARDRVPAAVRAEVLAQADDVLAGAWPLLGVSRPDLADPDWFADPVTGRRAPQHEYAFSIDHRDEAVTGNVKQVWEVSRHHHLTLLACAYWLTGQDRYAEATAAQLRSWWAANPYLSGINWTSGIEVGVRLVSWVWIRRLLHEWPGVRELFEENPVALAQIAWHQEYLEAFPSPGSSANNHAVAEDTGLLMAACAFGWYERSARWGVTGLRRFRRNLAANTFGDGLNRELASDYHGFVTELGLLAAVEAGASGHDPGPDVWRLLTASLDTAAALVDVTGRPPRQGDGDEGRGLILDGHQDAWALLHSIGAAIVGAGEWWPASGLSVAGVALGDLLGEHGRVGSRPQRRPEEFGDAGLVMLRSPAGARPEIWCRCDSGPHGFLSIAAHGHADALSVEVRHDGVDILADPGTYCYHGEPEWRSYFRSTRAHNTIEVDGQNQSVEGGPFMWTTRAESETLAVHRDGEEQSWTGAHTGYSRLDGGGVRHERTVRLHQDTLSLRDRLTGTGEHRMAMLLHLGPAVAVELDGSTAYLSWSNDADGGAAVLRLPAGLAWSAHRGESDPILGWYSPAFGERVPATTLRGIGSFSGDVVADTVLEFTDAASAQRAGWGDRPGGEVPGRHRRGGGAPV